jgi:hypothetical protein
MVAPQRAASWHVGFIMNCTPAECVELESRSLVIASQACEPAGMAAPS